MVAREIPNLKVSGSIPLLLNFLDFFVRLMMFIYSISFTFIKNAFVFIKELMI